MALWNNTDAQASKPKFINVGQVAAIAVLTQGSGYTNGTVAATISAPPAGGVQATANVTIAGGKVTGVVVTNPGAGYTSAPTVSVTSGGGSGATFAPDLHKSTGAETGIPVMNDAIIFVDKTEAALAQNRKKGIKLPGWIKYREYVNSAGATRYKVETLVAMARTAAAAGDSTDDTVVSDAAFAITTNPSNSSVTAPAAASFTVAATGATNYQWQLRPAAGGQYANITNGGVYTNATTATLNISNSTGLNGNRYRCVVLNSTAGASATSTAALLTVA